MSQTKPWHASNNTLHTMTYQTCSPWNSGLPGQRIRNCQARELKTVRTGNSDLSSQGTRNWASGLHSLWAFFPCLSPRLTRIFTTAFPKNLTEIIDSISTNICNNNTIYNHINQFDERLYYGIIDSKTESLINCNFFTSKIKFFILVS